jgi:parallel beta-helix repeat protein
MVSDNNLNYLQSATSNDEEAITLSSGAAGTVDHNTISNGYDGIVLYGATTGAFVSNNIISGTTHAGILVYENSTGNSITGNSVTNCPLGIFVGDGSNNNTFTNNVITDNGIGVEVAIISGGSAPAGTVFHDNKFERNTDFGIKNETTTPVDAENNWWGDISGPTHSSNLDGTGDKVSDNVNFDPWIGKPAAIDLEDVIEGGVTTEDIVETINPIDGFTMEIPSGTTVDLGEGNTKIEVTFIDEPPQPPVGKVLGLAYDFGPEGATFDPYIILTFHYNDEDVPEGVNEADLVVAYYNESKHKWEELTDCDVDTITNTIIARVTHFTTFGLLASPPTTVTRTVPVPYPGGETTITVTKSSIITQTHTRTQTQTGVTVTQTQSPTTLTQLSTITQTAGGAVITQTQTQTQVSTAISTLQTTKTATSTITQTVTSTATDWTLTAVLAVVGVLLGALIVAIVVRRSQ